MKVVTYATHSDGAFEELVNNKFGVEVVVLGWGTKWNGFMDKFDAIRKYINTLDDKDIVVFVDGFDSYILKPLDDLEETFKSQRCDILVSNEANVLLKFAIKRMYGVCKDNQTANSGLYMGYVFALKNMFELISREKTSDDQKNLNAVCYKLDNIKIDIECLVFKNVYNPKNINNEMQKTNAYFFSTPGQFSLKRQFRGIKEHYKTFIPEIILVILLLYLAFLHFVLKK